MGSIADSDAPPPSASDDPRIAATLEAMAQEVLPPVLTTLAVMFCFFAATTHLVLPPEPASVVRGIGLFAVVLFTGLRIAVGRAMPSPALCHAVILLATLVCMASAGTHLYLGNEPLLSNWFLLILVGLSQVLFAPRWFFVSIASVLVVWFSIVSALGWSEPLRLYAIAMVSFAATAAMMFYARRRTLYRLEDMRQRAEQANTMKSQFLANMSHELRTPLNAIIGYTEMLHEDAQDAQDPQRASDLERVQNAARHLLGLINDVLDLSKIEAGQMELVTETVELGALLDDVMTTLRPLADAKGNRLQCRVDAGVALRSDGTRIRQILLNLLGNANKFTHGGDIRLSAQACDAEGRPLIELVVEDTGIGMTEAQLQTVFDAFQQGSVEITRKYGGTGLGLAICKRLCEALGGSIAVESQPGRGSAFRVRLPAEP